MLKLQKFELKTKKFVLNFTQKNPNLALIRFYVHLIAPKQAHLCNEAL